MWDMFLLMCVFPNVLLSKSPSASVTQLLERISEVVEQNRLFTSDRPSLGQELETLQQHLESLSSTPLPLDHNFNNSQGLTYNHALSNVLVWLLSPPGLSPHDKVMGTKVWELPNTSVKSLAEVFAWQNNGQTFDSLWYTVEHCWTKAVVSAVVCKVIFLINIILLYFLLLVCKVLVQSLGAVRHELALLKCQ